MRTLWLALLLPAALEAADPVARPASFARGFDAKHAHARLVLILSPT